MANDVFKCDEQKKLDLVRFILHHHKLPIHKKIFYPTYMCFKHTTSMKKQFSHNFHQQIVGWEVCDGHLILMALQILLLILVLIILNEILYNLKWKEL
jgi:hypothetical protein